MGDGIFKKKYKFQLAVMKGSKVKIDELIQIKNMSIGDYERIIELWRVCEIRIEPEDDFLNFKINLKKKNYKGFVARSEGNIIGSIICGSDGRYGYIHHLAVKPGYRRKKVAASLVDKCKEFLLKDQGVKSIAIFVWGKNKSGNAFWSKVGFKKVKGLEVFAKEIV